MALFTEGGNMVVEIHIWSVSISGMNIVFLKYLLLNSLLFLFENTYSRPFKLKRKIAVYQDWCTRYNLVPCIRSIPSLATQNIMNISRFKPIVIHSHISTFPSSGDIFKLYS